MLKMNVIAQMNVINPILKLKRIIEILKDNKNVLKKVSEDIYESNEELIFNQRPGRYRDLSEVYKLEKRAMVGFVYPILVRTGTLKESLTKVGSTYNINRLSMSTLVLGTKVKYAKKHQLGLYGLPVRKPLDVIGRNVRWSKIIKEEIRKSLWQSIR